MPNRHQETPAGIPTWTEQPPAEINGHPAFLLVSDPFEDHFACNKDLEQRTAAAIELAARERCRQRQLPEDLSIDITFDEIAAVSHERFYRKRSTSMGDMLQAYQLTVLNDEFNKKLDQRIEQAVVHRRLAATGVGSAGVLLVVSLLFGTFRFVSRKSPDPLVA